MKRPVTLRIQLVGVLVVLLGAGLLLMGAGLLTALEANLVGQVDADLDTVGDRLDTFVSGRPAREPIPTGWTAQVGLSGAPVVPYVQVLASDGRPITTLDSAAGGPPLPDPLPPGWHDGTVTYRTVPDARRIDPGSWRVRAAPLPGGNLLLLARPLDEIDRTLAESTRNTVAAGLVVLVALSVLGWALVGRGLRPLRRQRGGAVRRGADRPGRGHRLLAAARHPVAGGAGARP